MKKRSAVMTILVALGLVMGCEQRPGKWQYEIVSAPDTVLVATLNTYGEKGWELVSARRAVSDGQGVYEILMKRPWPKGGEQPVTLERQLQGIVDSTPAPEPSPEPDSRYGRAVIPFPSEGVYRFTSCVDDYNAASLIPVKVAQQQGLSLAEDCE